MTKATIETYTVKTRNFECRAPKPTIEAAVSVARKKIWLIAPDEKVQVYRGEELVGEIEQSLSWSRLSEQIFRIDKWSLCRG